MIIDLSDTPRPKIDPKAVGRRLKALRALRGLSQEDLAAKAGVSHNTAWRAEKGTYSADTLVKLNNVLESSLDYILYGEG